GGLIGLAISGTLIAIAGSGWSIAANAVATAFSVLAISLMRVHELVPVPRQPVDRGQIREAIRYVWRKPTIRWPIVLVLRAAVFGMNLAVRLAAAAGGHCGVGAAASGLYDSLCAICALIGTSLSSRRCSLRLWYVIGCMMLYGSVTMLAGWDRWYLVFLSVL